MNGDESGKKQEQQETGLDWSNCGYKVKRVYEQESIAQVVLRAVPPAFKQEHKYPQMPTPYSPTTMLAQPAKTAASVLSVTLISVLPAMMALAYEQTVWNRTIILCSNQQPQWVAIKDLAPPYTAAPCSTLTHFTTIAPPPPNRS